MVKARIWIAIFALVLSIGLSSTASAGDGVPVTSMSVSRPSAIPSGPYSIAGETIRYGVGENVVLNSVVVSGNTMTRSAVSKPQIAIKRKNNPNVSGERLTLFYVGLVSGTNVNLEGDEALTMEAAMNDDYITSGGLDVFMNVPQGVEQPNNIERVDFVLSAGLNLPTTPALLSEIGTIANEKHGNNTYKIALITSLDSFGEPASYGAIKTIQGNVDYGNMGRPNDGGGTLFRNVYMRNGTAPVGGGSNGPAEYIRSDTNFIGLSFISFAALGATPGQTVYGYSLFPNDMFDSNDLVGLTDAPLNTGTSTNGGDIYGGTYAIFTSNASEPETSEGAPSINATKTVNIFDPLAEGLYSLPGNDVLYTINVTNTGTASPDNNSLFLVDTLPPQVTIYTGDIDDTGPETDPVIFTDSGSGLSFNYASDVGYSNGASPPTNMTQCNFSPAIGTYDPQVTHICFGPDGAFAHQPATPAFAVTFRARID